MGNIVAAVATLDLRVALHRGRENGTRRVVLHTVHRNEPLHHLRHGDSRVLRTRVHHGNFVLANMEGNGETSKGPAESAGQQA